MLSRVLRGPVSVTAERVVFPQISDAGASASWGPAGTSDIAPEIQSDALEKIRALESRLAVESRTAFDAGKLEGERIARAELQPVLGRLAASTADVVGMRSELRHRAEADCVQLALLIAQRILHRQLAVDDSALAAIAHVAFGRLTRAESYTVTVHPRFAAAISAAVPASQAPRVQIQAEPSCAPGTLIIQSSEGTIDASIDAQLEEISRGLTDRLALRPL